KQPEEAEDRESAERRPSRHLRPEPLQERIPLGVHEGRPGQGRGRGHRGAPHAAAGEGHGPHGSAAGLGGRGQEAAGLTREGAARRSQEGSKKGLVTARSNLGAVDSNQLQIELESFPSELRPMQAASAEAPFSSPEYLL